jgi:transketolase
VARTHIAIGAPTKQDTASAHGAPLGAAEVEATKKKAGWPLDPFHIAPEAHSLFKERVKQNRARYDAWQAKVKALTGERKALWEKLSTRQVPADLFGQLRASVEDKPDATRSLAAKVEQKLAELVPSLVGGSADLAESCKTTIKGGGDVSRGEYAGRNLHFGIREHAMGAICNGLALSGFFIPYGSTFLIFSDYMRPAVRLAALMSQQVVFVYTHDSVFLGEDGPTHQPIEQLWALRMIPNLDVMRPADALECAAAWGHAASRRSGPTAIVLTRQKLPLLERPANFDPAVVQRGAYALSDTPDPDLVLIATGSEVHVAQSAARTLAARGRRPRVISAPCWEAFERCPLEERRALLPQGVLRVALEAGRGIGWRGVVGEDGLVIAIDRFGASAPYERIAEELGFTAEKVADMILGRQSG